MTRGARLVVFDCDGTLVDSQHMIVAAMGRAFDVHRIPHLPRETVLSIVGLSLNEAVSKLLPQVEAGLVGEIAQDYRKAFFELRADSANREPLYDGAADTIRTLAARDDIVLGIATGKSQRGVAHLLERHGFDGMFSTIQTADDAPSKPNPAMLHQAMDETGFEGRDTLMVGDTSFDMIMARDAGVTPVGVAWGYHSPTDLVASGARVVLERFDDLGQFVDNRNRNKDEEAADG